MPLAQYNMLGLGRGSLAVSGVVNFTRHSQVVAEVLANEAQLSQHNSATFPNASSCGRQDYYYAPKPEPKPEGERTLNPIL